MIRLSAAIDIRAATITHAAGWFTDAGPWIADVGPLAGDINASVGARTNVRHTLLIHLAGSGSHGAAEGVGCTDRWVG